MDTDLTAGTAGRSVVVVGAGNIGSHVLPLIGRMPEVGSITIIDNDVYEPKNLPGQHISEGDFGKSKAHTQAQRMRGLNAHLRTWAIAENVENVPPGNLRGDVILGCLDSRESRRVVHQVAWQLGVPFIDAGVEPDGLLARVNVYRPGPNNPCMECAWDHGDYELLEQRHACASDRETPAPTNAPASLGALAAALQAIECQKILACDWAHVAVGRQVLVDAATHRHFVTGFRRNPHCRFNHLSIEVEPVACDGPLSALFELGRERLGSGEVTLGVLNKRFVRELACLDCLTSIDTFCLEGRVRRLCRKCDEQMQPVGMSMLVRMSVEDASSAVMAGPLGQLGFRTGDILTFSNTNTELHFEISKPL